jgi:spermidine dehydrogenase
MLTRLTRPIDSVSKSKRSCGTERYNLRRVSHLTDRQLGMHRAISRRDFVQGVAAGITLLGARSATAAPSDAAPPTRTGLRGSNPGSFEPLHALRDGEFWKHAGKVRRTRETYDLIVAGAGISGLAAAWFYRKHHPSARILLLDNHDDFGGHARRNEFHIGGGLQLMNGGTLEIDSPYSYSATADGLLRALGVEVRALAERHPRGDAFRAFNLKSATFFDRETFGEDRLVVGVPSGRNGQWEEYLARTPLSEAVRRDIQRLETGDTDYLPGLSDAEKKDRLSRISYRDFLLQLANADPGVVPVYQARTHAEYGVGIDAVSALDCTVWALPGFQGMALARGPAPRMGYTSAGYAAGGSYRFHFPDGNASIARMLVRRLIPEAAPGSTAEDIVTAAFDYAQLDRAGAPVRLRLASSVLRVRHRGKPASAKEVEVTWLGPHGLYSARSRHCIMACWSSIIPYLCPDLPAAQKEAMSYQVKVPLAYTTVGLRNWIAFQKLEFARAFCPGSYHYRVRLDFAPAIGGYAPSKSPDEPVLVSMERTPCQPGLPERDQHRAGRRELLTTPFSTFERNIRDQLARMLGAGGFDPARDIEAITVNRWPHGYAYEYNPLFDPDWRAGEAPHEIARRRFGRIAVANSDAAAAAYTDKAIDEAARAVEELSERH